MKGIHSVLESPPWGTPIVVERDTALPGVKVREFRSFYGYEHFKAECQKHGWTRWVDLDEIENNAASSDKSDKSDKSDRKALR